MQRRWAAAMILVGGAAAGIGGWVVRGVAVEQACEYTAQGYGRLMVDVQTLPELPLKNVSDDVIGEIQKCWAAHPFVGPQAVIELVDARKAPDGGYFLLFDPSSVTDVQVVFYVDANWNVIEAHTRSTF